MKNKLILPEKQQYYTWWLNSSLFEIKFVSRKKFRKCQLRGSRTLYSRLMTFPPDSSQVKNVNSKPKSYGIKTSNDGCDVIYRWPLTRLFSLSFLFVILLLGVKSVTFVFLVRNRFIVVNLMQISNIFQYYWSKKLNRY